MSELVQFSLPFLRVRTISLQRRQKRLGLVRKRPLVSRITEATPVASEKES